MACCAASMTRRRLLVSGSRNKDSLLAVLTERRGEREVYHAAEVDRRSSICRRISIIVDRWWSPLQERRDWPDLDADVMPAGRPEHKGVGGTGGSITHSRKCEPLRSKALLEPHRRLAACSLASQLDLESRSRSDWSSAAWRDARPERSCRRARRPRPRP
jgi:hypothetical protein